MIVFLLTKRSIEKKDKKELEKLHDLINDEFYRIYFYVEDSIQTITKLLENVKEYEKYILDIRYEIMRGRSGIIINFPNLCFLLWDIVISSGRLITLETEEIQLINSAHDDIKHTLEDIGDKFNHFDTIIPHTKENTKQYSFDEIKMHIHFFYSEIIAHLRRIKIEYESLDKKINWIKKNSVHLNPK